MSIIWHPHIDVLLTTKIMTQKQCDERKCYSTNLISIILIKFSKFLYSWRKATFPCHSSILCRSERMLLSIMKVKCFQPALHSSTLTPFPFSPPHQRLGSAIAPLYNPAGSSPQFHRDVTHWVRRTVSWAQTQAVFPGEHPAEKCTPHNQKSDQQEQKSLWAKHLRVHTHQTITKLKIKHVVVKS